MRFFNALKLPHLGSAPTPPADNSALYFKSDGLLYQKGPDGAERLVSPVEPSLHTNPNFDSITSGKPTSWSDFWSHTNTIASSDTSIKSAGVASAKLSRPAGSDINASYISAEFAVVPGGILDVSFDVRSTRTTTVPWWALLTNTPANSPEPFATGVTSQYRHVGIPVANAFGRNNVSYTIPAGHTRARFLIGFNHPVASGANIDCWFDESTSKMSISSDPLVPTGTMMMWAGGAATNLPPPGWLMCQGQAVSRDTYSNLFDVIGIYFGSGNGSTTFNLPDMRNRVPTGVYPASPHAGWVGANDGAAEASRAGNWNHTHNHSISVSGSIGSFTHATGSNTAVGGTRVRLDAPTSHTHSFSGSGSSGNANSGTHPFLALNFIIKD